MKRIITITCAAAGLLAGSASAELLGGYGAGATVDGRVAIGDYGFGGAYPAMQAMRFRTGSEAYYLESVDFGGHLYTDYGSGGLQLALHEDNSSVPGSVVSGAENLLGPIAPAVAVVLEANKTYWFVASADQSGGNTRYWWDLTSSSAFSSGVTGTDLPKSFATNADGSWTMNPGAGLMMSVNGSVIPEPGTVALTGIGMGAVWLARRRRMRRGRNGELPLARMPEHLRPFIQEERTSGLR